MVGIRRSIATTMDQGLDTIAPIVSFEELRKAMPKVIPSWKERIPRTLRTNPERSSQSKIAYLLDL